MNGILRTLTLAFGLGVIASAPAADFPTRVLDLEQAEAAAAIDRRSQADRHLAKAGSPPGVALLARLRGLQAASGLSDHGRERLLSETLIAARTLAPDPALRAAVETLAKRVPQAWVWLDEPGHAPQAVPYHAAGATAGLTLRAWNRSAVSAAFLKSGLAAAERVTAQAADRDAALAVAVLDLEGPALQAATATLTRAVREGRPYERALASAAARSGDAGAFTTLFAHGDPARTVHELSRLRSLPKSSALAVLASIDRPELTSAARHARAALDQPTGNPPSIQTLAVPTTCTFNGGEIANPTDPGCAGHFFTYTELQDDDTHIALGYPPPIPVASETPVAGFRTYATLDARHQNLMAATGAYTRHIVGTTRSGRDIPAYRLGDADTTRPNGGNEGAILINGGIHAREWQSPESVTEFLERLAEGADDGGVLQYIHENLTTVLIPVLNVDGFLQTQRYPVTVTAHQFQPREGRMRRKNLLNPNGGVVDEDITTITDNFFGVDLNRNNPDGFGQNNGSSNSVTSLIYRAGTPGSEPEITALRAAAALAPAERLRMYSDTHSFTQAYLVSTASNHSRLQQITIQLLVAMRAAGGGRYAAFHDAPGGDIGTTSDYFSETHRVPAWTLEIEPINGASDYGGSSHGHGGFITPDAHITRVRDEIARMYIMGAYRQAGPPAVREVIIADAGGTVIQHHRWDVSGNARTLTTLTDTPPVAGTTYTLWVAFDKPMDSGSAADRIGGGSLSVALRPGSGAPTVLGTLVASQWESTPRVGTGTSGYLRYARDAAVLTFTMPNLKGNSARLEFTAADLSLMALDANPATIADWNAGNWTGYESSNGSAGDGGGTDASIQISLTAGGAGDGGGGGGGAPAPLALLALGLALYMRRRALR